MCLSDLFFVLGITIDRGNSLGAEGEYRRGL